MGEPAKTTYIPDQDGAMHGLTSMAARSEAMGERIGRIADTIRSLEAGRPWGHAEEFGRQFENVYHAGNGGAEFVREQARILSTHTTDGLRTAHDALSASVQLDQEGAALFKGQAGDAERMRGIDTARQSTVDAERKGE
jgi:hypothetical protein